MVLQAMRSPRDPVAIQQISSLTLSHWASSPQREGRWGGGSKQLEKVQPAKEENPDSGLFTDEEYFAGREERTCQAEGTA